jgi:hypothetical protein
MARTMRSVRLLFRYPVLAAGLLLAALILRALVPVGYMPAVSGGMLTLQLCPGTIPAPTPMAGMHHGESHEAPPKPGKPCDFAALGSPALGTAGPPLVAGTILFAVVLAVARGLVTLPRRPARLRPPLRAPPVA